MIPAPDPTLCIYHSPCRDGFAAAWAVWRRYGNATRFFPGVHGRPRPDASGEHVLLVDFSYPVEDMRALAAEAASVTVLDHHRTAEAALAPLLAAGTIGGRFDMDHSGAVLAWMWCHPDTPTPALLRHVEDSDLARFQLADTQAINACAGSHPDDFAVWTGLVEQCATPAGRLAMVTEGMAIARSQWQEIQRALAATTRSMVIGGVSVPVANLPHTMGSEAANWLARSAPFAACYYDRDDARVFSLRSREDGSDVATIASLYGGGGHRHAAGFQAALGWEGDRPQDEDKPTGDATLSNRLPTIAVALADVLAGMGMADHATDDLEDGENIAAKVIYRRKSGPPLLVSLSIGIPEEGDDEDADETPTD